MHLAQILLLAAIQGLAELLPVSSSAHVILAERLMGLDPGAPEMTFLLVMLHTGTMFAVLVYFWPRWRRIGTAQGNRRGLLSLGDFVRMVIAATVFTGVVGLGLKVLIERVIFERLLGHAHGEVEHLFRNLPLMAAALFCAGILIILAGAFEVGGRKRVLDYPAAVLIGVVQGLALPFRGFSRSGATISIGLLQGLRRDLAEDFSFALAIVLTPPVVLLELRRLLASSGAHVALSTLLLPGLLGMLASFLTGLVALAWLSSWLEKGRWKYFGYYCVGFSVIVLAVAVVGL